ncbi:MAG: ubiquitin-like small modifier protein 1 [Halobacteriaceae archaeon]
MQWKLFADLAEITGERELEYATSETVRSALQTLIDDYPQLEDRIFENGEIADHINILHNGTPIEQKQGLDTAISNGDEIAIFPPVTGGMSPLDRRP